MDKPIDDRMYTQIEMIKLCEEAREQGKLDRCIYTEHDMDKLCERARKEVREENRWEIYNRIRKALVNALYHDED
jgi:hypothetical protein